MVEWKPRLTKVTACRPALTWLIHKCYGDRPTSVVLQMDPGKWGKLECSHGVKQRNVLEPDLFCLPLLPKRSRVRLNM